MRTDIDIRCNKTNQAIRQLAPVLQHKKFPVSMKTKLMQSILIPTLTFSVSGDFVGLSTYCRRATSLVK